jgi:uncharacterized RmlC-like cupin family protein
MNNIFRIVGFTTVCMFLLTGCIALLPAADQPTYLFWSAAQVAGFEKKLQASMNESKGADEIFMTTPSFFMMFHREGSAPKAEIHQTLGDFGVVRSGEGTIVVGPKLVGSKETRPGELRGDIDGGTRHQIAAGDMFYVPSGMPHHVLVAPGKHLDVSILKIERKKGATDLSQSQFWSATQLRTSAMKLRAKLDQHHNAVDQFVTSETYVAMLNYKEGTGESEIHEHLGEFQIIQTGEGAIMLGGKVVGAKTAGPGEVRGTALEGATRQSLMPGDMLYIPPNTPHHTLVQTGKSQDKLVIKVWMRD